MVDLYPTPTRLAPLPGEAAAWIHDVVLLSAYRDNALTSRRCPCQWGRTGHCAHGRHDRCPRTWGWERHGAPSPDTYVTDAHGVVAAAPTVASVAVWRAGRPCRWLCPCACHTQVQALIPPPPRQPGRASRTGGNARIAATDHIRAWDSQQLDLIAALEASHG